MTTLEEPDYEGLAAYHAALSDPNRLRILHHLTRAGGELSVGQIVDLVANLAQPTVSHHLAALWDARLVSRRKQRSNVLYLASEAGRAVFQASEW
jgi:DNA-binding transcriptional ArsR family regulator